MFKRFIDLSQTIANGTRVDLGDASPKVEYVGHREGATFLAQMYEGVISPDELPDGEGCSGEYVTLTTHMGTHMDAPWHYGRVMDGGKPAYTIDEVPLDWCFGPGVKLDFRSLPDGHVVTAKEIEAELTRIGHVLSPGDIVLVNTRAPQEAHTGHYAQSGCGLGREATLYLIEHGVRTMGTDAWSWDAPFGHVAQRVRETGDKSLIWEGHYAGKTAGYAQLEKLHNLEALPGDGFFVACFPVKIARASGGWTRAVALFP